MLTISIVSHGHVAYVRSLLMDLSILSRELNFKVILTANLNEDFDEMGDVPFDLMVVRNKFPLGFGRNHNNAFEFCDTPFFLVLNPDIRIREIDFRKLIDLFADNSVGVISVMSTNANNDYDDNARKFPSIYRLFKRHITGRFDYEVNKSTLRHLEVDWVAGLFMLFPSGFFASLNGFDSDSYFMYVEDVDICYRAKLKGKKTLISLSSQIRHDAQRASRKSLKHLYWHISGLVKFFMRKNFKLQS